MKKIILTMVAAFTLTFVNAQSRANGTIELIPQIGYSSANYYGKDVSSANKPITDLAFGVAGDYFFNNRWSLRSGLLFQTMGTSGTGFKDKLNYLTIPVNANWHFGSTRKWNLNFGPSIGFIMSATTNGIDIKNQVTSTQIGLNVGIGYKIEVSNAISILLDYQSLTGLTSPAKQSNYDFKNSFGSFDIGCVFKL